MSLQFRVDPAKKALVRVTETEVTAEELEVELQAEMDRLQNILNEKNQELLVKEAEHKTAEENLRLALNAVDEAETDVAFSKSAREELAGAIALQQELVAQSTETDVEAADGSVSVPVHSAIEAEV